MATISLGLETASSGDAVSHLVEMSVVCDDDSEMADVERVDRDGVVGGMDLVMATAGDEVVGVREGVGVARTVSRDDTREELEGSRALG